MLILYCFCLSFNILILLYLILGRTEVIGVRGTANMNTIERLTTNSPNHSRMYSSFNVLFYIIFIVILGIISLHPSVEQNSNSFSSDIKPRNICKPLNLSIMEQIQNRMYVNI